MARYPRIPLPKPRAGRPGEPSYQPSQGRPYPQARTSVAPPAVMGNPNGRPPGPTAPSTAPSSAFFAPAPLTLPAQVPLPNVRPGFAAPGAQPIPYPTKPHYARPRPAPQFNRVEHVTQPGYNPYYDPYRPLYGQVGPPLTGASAQNKSQDNPCAPDQTWDENQGICRAPYTDLGCCPEGMPPGIHCPANWPPCPTKPGPGPGDGKPGPITGGPPPGGGGHPLPSDVPPPPPPPPGGGGGGGSCPPECHVGGAGNCICPPPPGGVCPPNCSTKPNGDCICPPEAPMAPPQDQFGEVWPDLAQQQQAQQPQVQMQAQPQAQPPQGLAPPAPPVPAPAPTQTPPPAPTPAVASTVQYSRIPSAEEIAQLPMGTTVETPWGLVQPDENGEPRLIMNEQGKAAYLQAMQRVKSAYGPTPFASFPGAPQPEIVVGGQNFNPFNGMWTS